MTLLSSIVMAMVPMMIPATLMATVKMIGGLASTVMMQTQQTSEMLMATDTHLVLGTVMMTQLMQMVTA
jgi:hypothetical protein